MLLFVCNYTNGILKHNSLLEGRTKQDILLLENLLTFEKEHTEIEFEKMNRIKKLENFEIEELEKLGARK